MPTAALVQASEALLNVEREFYMERILMVTFMSMNGHVVEALRDYLKSDDPSLPKNPRAVDALEAYADALHRHPSRWVRWLGGLSVFGRALAGRHVG